MPLGISGNNERATQTLGALVTKGRVDHDETSAKQRGWTSIQVRINRLLGALPHLLDAVTGTFLNLAAAGGLLAQSIESH